MSGTIANSANSCVVEVYPFDLDCEESIPLDLALIWLSEGERERAERFRFPVHRERYLRGRAVMRGLLGKRLGIDPASLVLGEGDRGKPSLMSHSTGFNLSHSENLAVLAIGDAEVGVDIERYDRKVDHEGLGRRCFREAEIAWMEGFGLQDLHRGFFRIWTAKEARMKATGEGFQLEPKRISLEFEGERPVRIGEPAVPETWLESFDLFEGTAACAVVSLVSLRAEVKPLPGWMVGG